MLVSKTKTNSLGVNILVLQKDKEWVEKKNIIQRQVMIRTTKKNKSG